MLLRGTARASSWPGLREAGGWHGAAMGGRRQVALSWQRRVLCSLPGRLPGRPQRHDSAVRGWGGRQEEPSGACAHACRLSACLSVQLCARATSPARRTRSASGLASAAAGTATSVPTATPVSTHSPPCALSCPPRADPGLGAPPRAPPLPIPQLHLCPSLSSTSAHPSGSHAPGG